MTIFDITKSILLISIVGLVWFYGNSFVNSFNKPVSPAVIESIGNNAVKLSRLTASNTAVEELRKEFKTENSKILKSYEEQKRGTKEVLKELGEIRGKQLQYVNLVDRKSDKSTDNKRNNKLSYEFKKIYSKDSNGAPVLIAWVMYFPNQRADLRWKTGTYPLEYYTKIIETENTDGTFNRYAEVYCENNQMAETKGKQYPMKLDGIKWEKTEIKGKSFSLWNPRLGFGLTVTPDSAAPVLDLSTMSYGRTHRNMCWRFLTFGIGVDKSENTDVVLTGSFEPFSWNIGNFLPLVENMFTGPIISIDTNSNTSLGVKVAVPF